MLGEGPVQFCRGYRPRRAHDSYCLCSAGFRGHGGLTLGGLAEGAGNQSDALSAGQVHAAYDLSIMRTQALIFIANSDLAQLTSRMTKDQELRRYTNPSRRMPATPTLILAPDP